MSILTSKRKILEEAFYEAMEDNHEDFTYMEDIGNGQFETWIKPEYQNVDIPSMCDYLGMTDWLTKWTVEMIEMEEAC